MPNRIRRAARSAVGRKQLIRDEEGRLALEGSEVTGRLEESDSLYECPRVVIDGMMLTWAELGDLLSPHKGWSFHLTLGGDAVITDDARLARTLPMDMGAHRLLERTPPKWFVIALEHYPTPKEWRARRRHDGTPTGA